MTEVLGLHEWQSGWRIFGDLTVQECLNLRTDLINFVGMEIHGPPDVKHFNGRKGGFGIQVYQVIVESWLIISTWPEHGFFRVNLSSCKFFDHGVVTSWLSRRFGKESILKNYQSPL